MTPEQLAAVNAEHSHQRALFAWCNIAERFGFAAAWDDRTYTPAGMQTLLASVAEGQTHWAAVPELHWFHAIPNGGQRDAITAGKLKVEGVKRGVLDCFLPLPMQRKNGYGEPMSPFHGLYVEMKRPKTEKEGVRKAKIVAQAGGSLSPEQTEFVAYARGVGYAVSVCYDWISAARDVQSYIEAVRNGR